MKIVDLIYHVGDLTAVNGLECNPYLLVDGEEAVLVDPGSKLDFEVVYKKISEIIDPTKITYIILHHQDPDFCTAVPLFEEAGMKAKIVTSWRTMTLTQFYDFQSEYYILEEHGYELVLSSGRVLEFIRTPYLHFAGAFVTYDRQEKVLFSSDLFGAYSFNRTMFADESYMEKMLTFHEHYMPSNSVIRPVMEMLLMYEINWILPQHGSIIKENITDYIEALRTLECGTLLAPIKKDLLKSGGYLRIFNDIYKRLTALYEKENVDAIFQVVGGITYVDAGLSSYDGNPMDIWNDIFDKIKEMEGMLWITSMEPYVRKLAMTYDLPMPLVYDSFIKIIDQENQRLVRENQSLEQTIKTVNERLIKNSVTGLYNEVFLKSLLMEELEKEDWRDVGVFISIGIDNFSTYKLNFGLDEENLAMNNMSYLLKEQFGNSAVFKLDSTDFGVYVKGYQKEELIDKLDEVRIHISKSELFLSKITVSMGVAFSDEIKMDYSSNEVTATQYMELSFNRLREAKRAGKNRVCFKGGEELEATFQNRVLIVDSDRTNAEVLRTFIKKMDVDVYIAEDGQEALAIVEEKNPEIIITEINIPKLDGFLLKEKLLSSSKTKNIEVIYLSYQKDEDSVNRALELGVIHYFKKPYLLAELLGLMKRYLKGGLL